MKTKIFFFSQIILLCFLIVFRTFIDGQDFNMISGLYDQEQNSNTNRTLIGFSKLSHSTHLIH